VIVDAQNKLTCDSCNAEVCKDKRFVIDKAPDVVAFHLKRFATLDGSIDKIDKHVAYPSELDLKPFHSNPDKEVSFVLFSSFRFIIKHILMFFLYFSHASGPKI
jgi:ubiquitin C-terminal hydrolase